MYIFNSLSAQARKYSYRLFIHMRYMLIVWVLVIPTIVISLISNIILCTIGARIICSFGCSTRMMLLTSPHATSFDLASYYAGSIFMIPFVAIITLPAMPFIYLFAIAVAWQLQSPSRTAFAGALAASILVLPSMTAYVWFDTPPMYRFALDFAGLLEGLALWTPPVVCAGLVVGWTTARCAQRLGTELRSKQA